MKKHEQLGMNPSTASHRLVKDTLWRLVVQTGQDKCFRCSKPMTRENFSLEHKDAWLDSADPVGLYFDQENISFSHLSCNIKESRTRPAAVCGSAAKYSNGCRCDPCKAAKAVVRARTYSKTSRQARYDRTGN